jgi:hypothetical protein
VLGRAREEVPELRQPELRQHQRHSQPVQRYGEAVVARPVVSSNGWKRDIPDLYQPAKLMTLLWQAIWMCCLQHDERSDRLTACLTKLENGHRIRRLVLAGLRLTGSKAVRHRLKPRHPTGHVF